MKPVLIFRHIDFEGPGYLGEFLDSHSIPYSVIAVDRAASVNNIELDQVSAMAFMGGPMSANDDIQWINDEISLIKAAHARAMPVLGHCLGGQLISRALGSKVQQNPVKEIGWHSLEKSSALADQELFKHLPQNFNAFHWHGEYFELPENALHLFSSQFCQNQGYLLNKTLALQCHMEMQEEMIPLWSEAYQHEIRHASESIQTKETITEDLKARISDLHKIADIIYTQWLQFFQ